MANYVRKRRTYKLVFEDEEYKGLEIRARSVSVRDLNRVWQLQDSDADTAEDRQALVEEMLEIFAGALVDWNLTEDGVPVPPTLESLRDEELQFVLMAINAWTAAISRVDDASPLDENSDSGPQSPVESTIPMEALSPSQAS